MKVITVILLIIVFILLSACSSSVIPLQASLKKIVVKIENSNESTSYQLLSDPGRKLIDIKKPKDNDYVHFDISKVNLFSDMCFFVSDGKKVIPIVDDVYKFSNPVINKYIPVYENKMQTKKLINNAEIELQNMFSTLTASQAELAANPANYNNKCILLQVGALPEKPYNACSQNEEDIFINQNCQAIKEDENTTGERVGGTIGEVAGGLACAGFGKLGTGVCSLILGGIGSAIGGAFNSDKKYKNCAKKTRDSCAHLYQSWELEVNRIKSIPEELKQSCVRSYHNIRKNEVSIRKMDKKITQLHNKHNEITRRLSQIFLLNININNNNYCY